MSTYILTSDGELYHHGVKGQKWGVRRYQNKDGSLTKAGRKRYTKEEIDRIKSDIDELRTSSISTGKAAALSALGGIGGLGLTAGTILTTGMYSPGIVGMSIVSAGMAAVGGVTAAIGGIKVATLKAELKRATVDD